MAASRRHVLIGKAFLLCALAGAMSFYAQKGTLERAEEGERLTIEQYTADYDAHRAKLMKPVRHKVFYMAAIGFALFAAFGLYELLGSLIGLGIHKTGLLPDRKPEKDDDEIRAIAARYPGTDLSVSLARVHLFALPLMPAMAAPILVPYWLIWGAPSLSAEFSEITGPAAFLLVILASVVAHEGLHGLGFVLFGRISWNQIKFGIFWRYLAPYAGCRTPVSASAYRHAVALPGFMLGIVPGFAAIVTGSTWLLIYGLVMTVSAVGDLTILWVIRSVDSDRMVIDHPKAVGCWVLDETPCPTEPTSTTR
jgi:hypothetical protein